MKEPTFWKTMAWIFGVLLLSSMGLRASDRLEIPPAVNALLLGGLFTILLGNTVSSDPVHLPRQAWKAYRKKQHVIGMVFSIGLAVVFLMGVRSHPFISWFLFPIALLEPYLLAREAYIKKRRRKPRRGRF